jgi:DNA polymerase-3 subunit gamma/tau
MRRMWPEVLDAVRGLRRFSWILLSQHAQVVGVDGRVLQLGFATAGARDSFVNSSSDDVLRQALAARFGSEWRIEAIVDPSRNPDASAVRAEPPQRSQRQEPERPGRGAAEPAPPARGEPPAAGPSSRPGGEAERRDFEPLTPPEPPESPEPPDLADSIDVEEPVADDPDEVPLSDAVGIAAADRVIGGPVGHELLARELGASVVSEYENPA